MSESREEIERKLAEIEQSCAHRNVVPRHQVNAAIAIARSLLPALEVAQAAANLKVANDAVVEAIMLEAHKAVGERRAQAHDELYAALAKATTYLTHQR